MVRDMTQGNPVSVLIRFTIPVVLGNLFQQAYNIADSVVVGNFVGAEALAAVGASSPIVYLFVAIAVGGSLGSSVVIGQLFGAQDYKRTKTAVYTAMITITAISVLLTVLGLIINGPILRLLNTPADVIDLAATYLGIYFIGLIFLFLYNINTAVFNALGDSRTPLYLLIFSSLLNIGLDLLFVTRFHLGVAGVAWATLIAQALAAVLSTLLLMRRLRDIRAEEAVARFDFGLLRGMAKVAVPSMLQQSIVSLGTVSIQSVVNGFGTTVLAGFTAAGKIESIALMPIVNVGNSVANFVAQNIGARKIERIKSGFIGGLGMIAVLSIVITGAIYLWGDVFVGGFLDSEANREILEFGVSYLRIISLFFILFGAMNVVTGVIKGSGDMGVFMLATLTNFVIRIAACFTLNTVIGPAILWWSAPAGWAACGIIQAIRYFTGGWKKRALAE